MKTTRYHSDHVVSPYLWAGLFSWHTTLLFIGDWFFRGFYSLPSASIEAWSQNQPCSLVSSFLVLSFTWSSGLGGYRLFGSFGETSLMIVSTALTGFNDNAAITYLSTLVPTSLTSLNTL